MRAEGASEWKSTALSPSASQRVVVALSDLRPDMLAGRMQPASAAPSVLAERAAKRQAVSFSVLAIFEAGLQQ